MSDTCYIVDVSWLYDDDFKVYQPIFDIIPREALFTFVFRMVDGLEFPDNLELYFLTMLNTTKDNPEVDIEEYREMLDEVVRLMSIKIGERIRNPAINPTFITWLGISSCLMGEADVNRRICLHPEFKKDIGISCFYNRKEICNALMVYLNLDDWNELVNKSMKDDFDEADYSRAEGFNFNTTRLFN